MSSPLSLVLSFSPSLIFSLNLIVTYSDSPYLIVTFYSENIVICSSSLVGRLVVLPLSLQNGRERAPYSSPLQVNVSNQYLISSGLFSQNNVLVKVSVVFLFCRSN